MLLTSILLPGVAAAADRFFTTSDGVRLHYIEAGPNFAPTLVFVPGWTMPAWIFQRQIAFFSRDYHVVALDPRGQGDSDIPATGYEPYRRGADIGDLIAALGGRRVLLVGWSLGVLDSLAYVHQAGDGKLLGLVLIDNSVGEDPAPQTGPRPAVRRQPRGEPGGRDGPLRPQHVPPPAGRGLSGTADRHGAAHAAGRLRRAAVLPGAAERSGGTRSIQRDTSPSCTS